MFDIRDHLEFNSRGRASCPVCEAEKGKPNTNLSVNSDGAYKCHRGCPTVEIRAALGAPKAQQIPTNLAKATAPKSVTVSPQKVKEAHDKLMQSDGPAKEWLLERGITPEIMVQYRLGVVRAKVSTKDGDRHLPAISIPIPNADGTQYYQKKRVAPWLSSEQKPPECKPWSQYGIPAQVFMTWEPDGATETYLCEGEWDAMLLGWQMQQANQAIAVACFTCGCSNVPSTEQLERLPGRVTIFYDRNDKPLPNGTIPGEVGAAKAAAALGDRAQIALVPMPDGCKVEGWDISDALNHGFTLVDLAAAAAIAKPPEPQKSKNPLRERLVTNDELLARAPDYTDWLVPDILTTDELFLLAAAPRAGKSLFAMTLTLCVASGQNFLDRPVTQGPVLYIRCEDSETKTKEREIAQGWAEGLPVYWLNKFKLSELAYLIEIAEEIDPVLIVIDTLSRVRDDTISESSAEMSKILEPLQELAERKKICILLVHHTGKINLNNTDSVDVFDTIRGSSAIRATCRGTLVLAADEKNYRLCAENGYGKVDLKILLDAHTLQWKLLGHWNPVINIDQKTTILDYLNKFGSGSVVEIAEKTGISAKSVGTVLGRLQADELITKQGGRGRSPAIYHRSSNLLQQLEQKLEHPNADPVSDRPFAPTTYKNSESEVKSDHFAKSDHATGAKHDHFSELEQNTLIVGTSDQQPSNPDAASDTMLQLCSNFAPTVGTNSKAKSKSKTAKPHTTPSIGVIVNKKKATGWTGKIVDLDLESDQAQVLWNLEQHPEWLPLSELKVPPQQRPFQPNDRIKNPAGWTGYVNRYDPVNNRVYVTFNGGIDDDYPPSMLQLIEEAPPCQ